MVLCTFVAALVPGDRDTVHGLDEQVSAREKLLQIENAPPETRQALVGEFLAEAQEKGFPLIDGNAVCFVYSGDVRSSVFVAGDFNGWNPSRDAMERVQGTDLFYRFYEFPLDARLDYKLVPDGRWILDPLNPRTMMGGFGPNSELRMPLYKPPIDIEHDASIQHGTLEGLLLPDSTANRTIVVYLPPGYSESQNYPVLYVHDGGDYLRFAKIDNVMDNLLAAGKIRPTMMILIDPIDRRVEYAMDPRYADFVTNRLVPHVDTLYSTIDSPSGRCIMGASLGGLISLYIALENTDLFGSCAAQSTAFRYAEELISSLEEEESARPVRLYVDCGTFETGVSGHDLLQQNREAETLFRKKGYELEYAEYPEGHSWGNWRARLDEILTHFFAEGREER